MIIDHKRLDIMLSKDEISKFYYFFGEENFLQEEFVSKICSKIPNANVTKLFVTEMDINELRDTLFQEMLFAQRKIIVIKEAEYIEQDLENELIDLFKADSNFILVTEAKTCPKNKIYDYINKNGYIVEFKPLKKHELKEWIYNYIRKNGKIIANDAIEEMINLIGSNLMPIKREIEKILLFKKDENKITVEDVIISQGYTKRESIFAFEDAVVEKNIKKLLAVFHNLLLFGEEPTYMISLIYNTIKKILCIKSLLECGYDREYISWGLNMPLFKIDKFINNLGKFDNDELFLIFERLYSLDLKIKRGFDPITEIELFLVNLCGKT